MKIPILRFIRRDRDSILGNGRKYDGRDADTVSVRPPDGRALLSSDQRRAVARQVNTDKL